MPGPGLRKPRLAIENPRMLAAERCAANVLDAWVRRRGVHNAELAEAWGVSEAIVRGLRTRERPLRVAHVLMLPATARRALFALLEDADSRPDRRVSSPVTAIGGSLAMLDHAVIPRHFVQYAVQYAAQYEPSRGAL